MPNNRVGHRAETVGGAAQLNQAWENAGSVLLLRRRRERDSELVRSGRRLVRQPRSRVLGFYYLPALLHQFLVFLRQEIMLHVDMYRPDDRNSGLFALRTVVWLSPMAIFLMLWEGQSH